MLSSLSISLPLGCACVQVSWWVGSHMGGWVGWAPCPPRLLGEAGQQDEDAGRTHEADAHEAACRVSKKAAESEQGGLQESAESG